MKILKKLRQTVVSLSFIIGGFLVLIGLSSIGVGDQSGNVMLPILFSGVFFAFGCWVHWLFS